MDTNIFLALESLMHFKKVVPAYSAASNGWAFPFHYSLTSFQHWSYFKLNDVMDVKWQLLLIYICLRRAPVLFLQVPCMT